MPKITIKYLADASLISLPCKAMHAFGMSLILLMSFGKAESRSAIQSSAMSVQKQFCMAFDWICGTGPSNDGGNPDQQKEATNGGQISHTSTGHQQSPQQPLEDFISALLRNTDDVPPPGNQI